MTDTTTTRRRARKPRQEVGAQEGREDFSQFINTAATGDVRIVLTKHGAPVAAIVSIDDLKTLESSEAA